MSVVTLSKRILAAAPGIQVWEVVSSAALLNLPLGIAMPFSRMIIEWLPNRVWGESFRLGAPVLKLGHRQGDHVAQQPELGGWPPEVAAEMLQQQIEGSALHELGHALIDFATAHAGLAGVDRREVMDRLRLAAQREAAPSTYSGHGDVTMSHDDVLHEQGAEAFRWWCVAPQAFEAQYPVWGTTVRGIVQLCGGLL